MVLTLMLATLWVWVVGNFVAFAFPPIAPLLLGILTL
jgi:hypothetical protein